MFSKLVKTTLAVSLCASFAFGASGVRFNVIDGDQEVKYEKEFLPSLEDATGFSTSDPHEKIDDAYAQRYGNPKDPDYDKAYKKTLDNLGFFSVSNDKKIHDILLKAPQAAAFDPFNLLIYKKVNENKTYIGHIVPDTMLDIAGVTDSGVRKAFNDMFTPLDAYVTKQFGGKVVTTEYSSLPKNTMMHFEVDLSNAEDITEFVESFQEELEAKFEENKYVIAGFKDFKGTYADLEIPFEKYDQFFVYGLCHFTFSYNVFNKGRPDAGVFAPCNMYFYVEKGSKKMVVGMAHLDNWIAVMNIKDPAMIKEAKVIDAQIISIMKSLGAKEI